MEHIYNIFLFFQDDICSTIGYKAHAHSGSDKDGFERLKARLSNDLQEAVKMKLKRPFSRSEYNARCRLGEGHHLCEDVFTAVGANAAPLFVITPVKDDAMFFNYSSMSSAIDINDVSAKLGAKGVMDDWRTRYTNETGVNISQLIHDDYFLAFKVTFNAGLFVSAMKLLVSCIDSLAYIEYGTDDGAFVRWLEAYADLTQIGVTAIELWELRNGLLHMTNINAKKVRQNKVRRISFRVGGSPDYLRDGADGIHFFDFHGLIQVFAEAQCRWIETYNSDRSKFAKFVERYDETISDSRIALVHVDSKQL